MRYTLDSEGMIRPVVIIDLADGSKMVHPDDDIIDVLKAGYKLVNTRQPKYDPKKQHLTLSYEIKNGKIAKKWDIQDGPESTGD